MKFLPTINLWSNGVQDAIIAGQMKLQTGQWVTCGTGNKKARFVGVSKGGTLLVAHEQGSPKANAKRFADLLKLTKERMPIR